MVGLPAEVVKFGALFVVIVCGVTTARELELTTPSSVVVPTPTYFVPSESSHAQMARGVPPKEKPKKNRDHPPRFSGKPCLKRMSEEVEIPASFRDGVYSAFTPGFSLIDPN